MARGCVCAGLALAILMLCGCSSAVQRVDLSQWQMYMAKDPYSGDDAPRRAKASPPTPRALVARDLIQRADREEAAFARSEFRPWTRVDTKEREELEAVEVAGDRRLKEAKQSICRGC